MFLSEKWKSSRETAEEGSLGTISVGGETSTVTAAGMQVSSAVFGPSGMHWIPQRGDSVLVIKAGGTENCVVGVEMQTPEDMQPGEIRLESQGASLWLKNDGTICLEGQVLINGKELE